MVKNAKTAIKQNCIIVAVFIKSKVTKPLFANVMKLTQAPQK